MVDMDEVQGLLKSLMAELDGLVQQRELLRQQEEALKKQTAEMDRRIGGLQQSIQGLSLYSTAKIEPPELTHKILGFNDAIKALTSGGESRIATKSLADCCRDILQRDGGWLTALQVRQGLHAAGFDFSGYTSNPLSSIHTTLKRIVESGQAWNRLDIKTDDGLYRWKKQGEVAAPAYEPENLPAKGVDSIHPRSKYATRRKRFLDGRMPSPKNTLTTPDPSKK